MTEFVIKRKTMNYIQLEDALKDTISTSRQSYNMQLMNGVRGKSAISFQIMSLNTTNKQMKNEYL
jgi:hypothetical protein